MLIPPCVTLNLPRSMRPLLICLTVLALAACGGDDGLPDPPHSVTITWSKVSGKGTVTFSHPHLAGATAGFSAAGTYVLRLTATERGCDTVIYPPTP